MTSTGTPTVEKTADAKLPSPTKTAHTCSKCVKTGVDFERCGRCLAVFYCSRDCQTQHWKTHRPACIQLGNPQYKVTKRCPHGFATGMIKKLEFTESAAKGSVLDQLNAYIASIEGRTDQDNLLDAHLADLPN